MATFTNQATLSYNNTVTSSNIVTGELVEDIEVTKIAVIDTYSSGDDVTYIVSIANSGASAITGLTLTDNLGAYTFNSQTLYPLTYIDGSVRYFINGILQPAPVSSGAQPISFTGISVPAGGNALIIYEALVNEFAPLSTASTIENTVTVSGGGLSTEATASETITVSNEPQLTISKNISPSTVTENSQITYTFTIQNYGNSEADATDNAVVTDTFNPVLSNITVAFNGATWAETTDYTYDEATGLFTTVAGKITVPAATYVQDSQTGAWVVNHGESTLIVTGTV